MNTRRMVGIVLLAVGVILLVVGLNASDSMADRLSETFTGRLTDSTAWYVYGGLATALLGGLLALFGGRRGVLG